jgi:hypothetical protein
MTTERQRFGDKIHEYEVQHPEKAIEAQDLFIMEMTLDPEEGDEKDGVLVQPKITDKYLKSEDCNSREMSYLADKIMTETEFMDMEEVLEAQLASENKDDMRKRMRALALSRKADLKKKAHRL